MATTTKRGKAARVRVVLYVRISSDPDGLEKGVTRQQEDCRALAKSLGWTVVRVFAENDTSAYKQKVVTLPTGERVRRVIRPEFRGMLTTLTRGGADAVIAYDLDRAVRDPRDLEDMIDTKVLYGFDVRSVTGSLRLENDSDIAMARVMVAMANKSSADTARRVKRAALQAAQEGRWHGGKAPFGYRVQDSTLVPVPEHAAMLRQAADMILAGHSLYRVIRDWNEAGIASAQGTAWETTAIRQMLTNPAITGIRTYRPVLPDGSLSKEPALVSEGVWEPILDRETFEQVGQVIDERGAAHRVRGRARKRLYPFSGIVRCGRCGIVMRKQCGYYVCCRPERGTCSRRIHWAQANAVIFGALMEAYSSPRLLERLSGVTKLSEEAKHVRKQLAADRAALSRLDDDHYDGVIGRATWLRQRGRIEERITSNQAVAEQVSPVLPASSLDVSAVAAEWESRSPEWQNQAARLLLDRVIIHAHPKGMGSTTHQRKGETAEEHQARHRELRAAIMAERVELVWAR